MKSIIRLLFLATFLPLIDLRAAEPLRVVVLAGQSNMVGVRSQAEELPEAMRSPQSGALFWTGKGWEPLAPGVSEPRGFGPEISFAHAFLRQSPGPIGLIKHSVGGTALATRWNPDDPKSLYTQMLKKVREAGKDRPIQMIAMLWMQGERDSKDADMAAAYARNLKHLIESARRDLAAPEMVFLAGRVNPPADRYPHVEQVRAAQASDLWSGYGHIDCDDLTKGNDDLHYDTQGIRKMGERFATKLRQFLSSP